MKENHKLYPWGGICGIIGTTCYSITIALPINLIPSYMLAMSWPILSIIFAYAIYRYVAIESQSTSNQLAFLMACIGFAILSMMISVQFAVGQGMAEHLSAYGQMDEGLYDFYHQSLRMVDLGLDVAWDLFIGTSLIFMFFALRKNKSFGTWWASPAIILGPGLIILNVITYPWPPNKRGLLDIGPVVGVFIIVLGGRLVFLANRMKKHSLI